MDLNKRLIIALVLSFVILFGFSYLFPQQKASATAEANRSTPVTASANAATAQAAPSTGTSAPVAGQSNVAPAASGATAASAAPSTKKGEVLVAVAQGTINKVVKI